MESCRIVNPNEKISSFVCFLVGEIWEWRTDHPLNFGRWVHLQSVYEGQVCTAWLLLSVLEFRHLFSLFTADKAVHALLCVIQREVCTRPCKTGWPCWNNEMPTERKRWLPGAKGVTPFQCAETISNAAHWPIVLENNKPEVFFFSKASYFKTHSVNAP